MNPAINIQTKSGNLQLKNPIMSASGTFGYGTEYQNYGDIVKLGAVVVKGLSLKPRTGNALPRIAESACGMLNAVGLQNDGVEAFITKKLPHLPHKHVPIIANVYGSSIEEFAELGKILNSESAISAIEVNISCPNVSAGGIIFGQNPAMAESVVAAVKKNAPKKIVIVKLSPNVTDIASIGKAAENGGADMLSCINTLLGMAVDINTKRPVLANVVGGLSGAAIKPVALRCVWQVVQAVKIPVIGIGGIYNARDVLEFILVGASAVQVGTASFSDPAVIFRMVEELPKLCQELHIEDLEKYRNSLISN